MGNAYTNDRNWGTNLPLTFEREWEFHKENSKRFDSLRCFKHKKYKAIYKPRVVCSYCERYFRARSENLFGEQLETLQWEMIKEQRADLERTRKEAIKKLSKKERIALGLGFF